MPTFWRANAAIFVVEADCPPVGLVEVFMRQDADDPAVVRHAYEHVQSPVVTEEWRGRGLGRTLLEAARGCARERGAADMRLSVWEFAGDPAPFYERLGYRTLKRTLIAEI